MRSLFCLLFFLNISNTGISQDSIDSLNSTILGDKRTFKVYHPNVDEPTLLVIVLDGHNYFDIVKSTTEYLSRQGQMPYATIVGISGSPREHDFTPIPYSIPNGPENFGGGAAEFFSFIKNELIPHLEKKYQLSTNRTLIGHSLGGLFTLHVMVDDSMTFSNYVVASPSLFWGNDYTIEYFETKLDSTKLKNKNLIYSYENPINSEVFRNKQFETLPDSLYIKRIEKLFDEKDVDLNRQFFYYPNYNHVSMAPVAINDAIVSLFSFYPLDTEALANLLDDSPQEFIHFIDKHFKNISEKLGYEVIPKEGFLRGYARYIETFMKDKNEFSKALKEKADSLYKTISN